MAEKTAEFIHAAIAAGDTFSSPGPSRGIVSVKTPEECTSLQDIRAAIDDIDHDIIALIARRRGYVLAAATFKTSAASVSAPDRVAAMMARRRQWAMDASLSPEPIEHIFQTLVAYFTDAELRHYKGQNEGRPHER